MLINQRNTFSRLPHLKGEVCPLVEEDGHCSTHFTLNLHLIFQLTEKTYHYIAFLVHFRRETPRDIE